uniref:THAP domain-containing protein 1 n=1 Tax=Cyprinus carpio TaxID=7962 RepID=A0A8C1YZY8_CYPCA
MAKRCVFGCLPNKTLFSIPRLPWLRSRWLEFLHFEEEGLTVNSRLCSRHFTPECFQNLTQHQMGFAKVLYLKNSAVPSVYTVGASQSMKPLTRDVGCQCTAQTPKKSISVQASFPIPKPKRRSKAVQVNSSGHPVIASSEYVCAHLETPERTSTPIKRPRMEESVDEFNDRSSMTLTDPEDITHEPEITEDDERHCAKHGSHTVMNMSDRTVLYIKLEN